MGHMNVGHLEIPDHGHSQTGSVTKVSGEIVPFEFVLDVGPEVFKPHHLEVPDVNTHPH
jgi:hypothetical protein